MARSNFGQKLTAFLYDMTEAGLRSFAEGQEFPQNDEQTELRICAYYLLFEKSTLEKHLERAIHLTEGLIASSPIHDPDRDRRFDILSMLLARMYQRERLEEGVSPAPLGQLTNCESPSDDIGFHRRLLKDRAAKLMTNYEQSNHIEDLNKAIRIVEQLVHGTNRYNEPGMWNNLGVMFLRRFQRTDAMEDLGRAIDAATMAVDGTPQGHPKLAVRLNNLALWLSTRCERTGVTEDFDRAVDTATRVMDTTPRSHPDFAGYLSNLGNRFGRRFERMGAVEDLDRAIDAASTAMLSTPQDHNSFIGYLNNLGTWLCARFEKTDAIEDLNCAVDTVSSAVDFMPQDHPDRAICLSTLGASLSRRYERTGTKEDLDRAVDVATKAVDATSQDNPDFAPYSNNLSITLGMRFQRTGVMEDLDHAIVAATRAVRATPEGHPKLAGRLNNLANRLSNRFERIGAMEDLDHAVDAASRAVAITPQDHPNLARSLSNLGNMLGTRFERTGALEDLRRAIKIIADAINATPQGHSDLAGYLNNLGLLLGKQFEKTGVDDDIVRAIEAITKAVDMTPEGHPDLASYLNNLGNKFGSRFKKTGSKKDLDRGVETVARAVDAMPEDHPGRSSLLNNLGNWLGKRFERTRATDDLDRQLASYTQAWNCETAPPSIRIRSAGSAASVHALQERWESASSLLQEAVTLLPKVSLRSLTHTDRQGLLVRLYGLASMAAATALSAKKGSYNALRLLELGRGLIAGFLMDIRTDVSDLERTYPDLAERFMSLRNELDRPVDDGFRTSTPVDGLFTQDLQRGRHYEVDRELDELIETIRTKPDFQTFLQPPTEAELTAAATPDPIIVVNVSFYRCDAFIIEHTGIRVIELPDLSQKKVDEWAVNLLLASDDLTPLLKWLWHAICRPCLEALRLTSTVSNDNWPHVWWIPTGVLSQMPLHAAGCHGQGSTETVLDRTMSSYAVSIKSLLRGRRQDQNSVGKSSTPSALLVAMQETPRSGRLPYAGDEVDMLRKLCPSLRLDPVTPRPLKVDVLACLQTCRLFHFAGHGRSDPTEPSRSCLLLQDWEDDPLTVQNLRDSQLQENRPFLAYLSACSTGANKDLRLADEGIHLVSAFQLTGFRHVVGTLWEVSDKHCVDVARVFYKTLRDEGMTDMAVCRALHRALRTLRDGEVKGKDTRDAELLSSETQRKGPVNTHWIPYVHFGA